ncbi:MAG: hypothetical protein ACLGXA_15500 [Acidobacteriota bacterium]
MKHDENQQAHIEDETNHGGAAPEHRRCQYLKADGKGCRDWAVRGQEFCYRHGVFLRAGRGIDVPLLEDESSIVLVLSETLRAVACGMLPLNNARLMIDGCRLAHTMHMERQKAAGVERVRRHQCVCEEAAEVNEKQEAGRGKQEVCGARCPEPGAQDCEEPNEVEREIEDTFDPGYEDTPVEVLAANAAPLNVRRNKEDLAVGVR